QYDYYSTCMFPLLCSLCASPHRSTSFFFFLTNPATTEIYTLSLHDALPISNPQLVAQIRHLYGLDRPFWVQYWDYVRAIVQAVQDRKSTRLNSSHRTISYAVFCLKKKKKKKSAPNKYINYTNDELYMQTTQF